MKNKPSSLVDTRVVWCGDNLEKLKALPSKCVDLIYIDPPFNSNRDYEVFWGENSEKRAFDDRHASTQAYIDFMRPRCEQLARVLKPTGSFYYHCDWHASHYVKIMLDQILGESNFHNEIMWLRTSSHNDSKRAYGTVNDSVLYYTGGGRHTFNAHYQPYSEEYATKNFKYREKDGRRYSSADLRSPNPRPNLTYDYKGYKPHRNGWTICIEKMKQWDKEGRLIFPASKDGRIRVKKYLHEMQGVPISNVWLDIPQLSSQSAERLGYPTQKPLTLLERIIRTSSNENDVVLDAFCGCGTALAAAQMLGRQWIGIDISPTACRVIAKRMKDVCRLGEDEALWRMGRGFIVRDLPRTEAQLRKMPPFEFENWAVIAVGGSPNKVQVGDMGIDGRVYPTSEMPKEANESQLAFMDTWYPIQVKQVDKAGRPDIDKFEAVLMRENRTRGYFVSFGYSSDALQEINSFFKRTGREIIPFTVQQLLDEDFTSHRRPPKSERAQAQPRQRRTS